MTTPQHNEETMASATDRKRRKQERIEARIERDREAEKPEGVETVGGPKEEEGKNQTGNQGMACLESTGSSGSSSRSSSKPGGYSADCSSIDDSTDSLSEGSNGENPSTPIRNSKNDGINHDTKNDKTNGIKNNIQQPSYAELMRLPLSSKKNRTSKRGIEDSGSLTAVEVSNKLSLSCRTCFRFYFDTNLEGSSCGQDYGLIFIAGGFFGYFMTICSHDMIALCFFVKLLRR